MTLVTFMEGNSGIYFLKTNQGNNSRNRSIPFRL